MTNIPTSRRSFFWNFGAGVSTALASTAGLARSGPAPAADDAALRAALLEDSIALRDLHGSYERAMDEGRVEEAVSLFAEDAEVLFNGRAYRQRQSGVIRLYRDIFAPGMSGRRMEPAPGFELAAEHRQEHLNVAANRLSATAVFPYSIRVGMPMESATSLASMARLHGEGVRSWWEGGAYRATYSRRTTDERWKISRLEFDTLARADWRAGRSYASPLADSPMPERFLDVTNGAGAVA